MSELDDKCERLKRARQGEHIRVRADAPAFTFTVSEVIELYERCRKAEAEAEKRFRVGIEEMNAKEKAWVEREAAERNLACIADMLNTWAREMNQREVTDYLGPCVLRDALRDLSGYANLKRYEAESRLARWPEAVEKVREAWNLTPSGESIGFALDEVSRLATEKREESK